jgi:F5/8 type C domain
MTSRIPPRRRRRAVVAVLSALTLGLTLAVTAVSTPASAELQHPRQQWLRRSSSEDSARIRDYRVYVSNDGSSWGSPVKTGTMRSARGIQFIDVGATARYVRLEVTSTWAASSAGKYYKKLNIDEMYVAGSYA